MNELEGKELYKPGFSYRDILGQDRWETFTPSFTSLTVVGSPTYTGRFRVVGKWCQFQVTLVSSTSIASTAGTTYFTLPITSRGIAGHGVMTNATTNIAVGTCHIDVTNGRCYPPTQTASGNTFHICGGYEV